jgi:hypothetical protein
VAENETNEQGGGVGAGGDDSVGDSGDAGIGGVASGSNPGSAAGRPGCGASALIAIVGLGAAVGGAVTAVVHAVS